MNGDGSSEAGRLLGMLGLPNDTTMDTRTFGIIEERIAPVMLDLHEQILWENLQEEVRLSVDANKCELWKQSLDASNPFRLEAKDYPSIKASFDTGWNQRCKLFNSPSSHSFLVGSQTRSASAGKLFSELCAKCSTHNRNPDNKDVPVPEHCCLRNFEGSSGSMEPQACVDVVIRPHEKFQVNVSLICMDDDSSTRAALQWNNATYKINNNTDVLPQVLITRGKNIGKEQDRPDKGSLPGHTPEPACTADPNHRRKTLTGDLLTFNKKLIADKFTMTKMDVQRLGKNCGCMLRGLRTVQEKDFERAARACLEHHFDNHEDCGVWCRRKSLTTEEAAASNRHCRCKIKDSKLCDALASVCSRFFELKRLKEVAHGMDANVNESINNTISYFAPKNRVHCATRSLQNRISIAIGMSSLGFKEYFVRLFKALGTQLTPNVLHWLTVKDEKRVRRITKSRTTAKKRIRQKRKFERLKELEADAKRARDKREGTHKSGGNLNGFHGKRKARSYKSKECPFCRNKGHVTKRSKKCRKNKAHPLCDPNWEPPPPAAVEPAAAAAAATISLEEQAALNGAADVDEMDCIPLTESAVEEDAIEPGEFHDRTTWNGGDLDDDGMSVGEL